MGAPYTHYDQLADLSRGVPDVVELFRKYSAFVVVVFDPESDRAFKEAVEEQFMDLDRFTGPDLLFFAPVPPPQTWLEDPRVRRRPYVASHGLRARRGADLAPWPEVSNPRDAMRAASILLGLPRQSRPYLAISKDLSKRDGWWMETSGSVVQDQLHLIGSAATRERMGFRSAGFEASIAELAEETGSSCGRLASGMMPSAAAALAAVGTGLGSTGRTQGGGEAIVERALAKFLPLGTVRSPRAAGRPTEPSADPSEEDLERIQRNALDVATLATLRRGIRRLPRAVEPRRITPATLQGRLEPYVHQLLLLGEEVLGLGRAFGDLGERLSFAAVLCWSVAVEIELNASLGHLIRAKVGVTLPEYYDLHQKRLSGAAVQLDERTAVPFNRVSRRTIPGSTRRLWQPPELGNLRRATEKVWDELSKSPTALGPRGTPIDVPSLYAPWTELTAMRNLAAHEALTSAMDVEATRLALDEILGSSAVLELCGLKERLSGQQGHGLGQRR